MSEVDWNEYDIDSGSVWAETVNAKGGINVLGKMYKIELITLDVGHSNGAIEAAGVQNATRMLVNNTCDN